MLILGLMHKPFTHGFFTDNGQIRAVAKNLTAISDIPVPIRKLLVTPVQFFRKYGWTNFTVKTSRLYYELKDAAA